jgi:hypothetical protein
MAEEKKVGKVAKIQARLNQGWRDTDKLVADTGASMGTVKVQMYKFYKDNPEKKPVKVAKK